MPSIVITLTDTPTGGVSIHTDYQPAVGRPCSPAQAASMDILRRTRKEYGLPDATDDLVRRPAVAAMAEKLAKANPTWTHAQCAQHAKAQATAK